MDVLKAAATALHLIEEGRRALAEIRDSVNDGKSAFNAKTTDELEALLAAERVETRAAFNALDDAIKSVRGG